MRLTSQTFFSLTEPSWSPLSNLLTTCSPVWRAPMSTRYLLIDCVSSKHLDDVMSNVNLWWHYSVIGSLFSLLILNAQFLTSVLTCQYSFFVFVFFLNLGIRLKRTNFQRMWMWMWMCTSRPNMRPHVFWKLQLSTDFNLNVRSTKYLHRH